MNLDVFGAGLNQLVAWIVLADRRTVSTRHVFVFAAECHHLAVLSEWFHEVVVHH